MKSAQKTIKKTIEKTTKKAVKKPAAKRNMVKTLYKDDSCMVTKRGHTIEIYTK